MAPEEAETVFRHSPRQRFNQARIRPKFIHISNKNGETDTQPHVGKKKWLEELHQSFPCEHSV